MLLQVRIWVSGSLEVRGSCIYTVCNKSHFHDYGNTMTTFVYTKSHCHGS